VRASPTPPRPVRQATNLLLAAGAACALALAGVLVARARLAAGTPRALATTPDVADVRWRLYQLNDNLRWDLICVLGGLVVAGSLGLVLRRPVRHVRRVAWGLLLALTLAWATATAYAPEAVTQVGQGYPADYRRAVAALLPGWYPYLRPPAELLLVAAFVLAGVLLARSGVEDFYDAPRGGTDAGLWSELLERRRAEEARRGAELERRRVEESRRRPD
jgi:hypothetical protein